MTSLMILFCLLSAAAPCEGFAGVCAAKEGSDRTRKAAAARMRERLRGWELRFSFPKTG